MEQAFYEKFMHTRGYGLKLCIGLNRGGLWFMDFLEEYNMVATKTANGPAS